ncbi:hypothetical protein SARC_15942, partial [Sphaeroforma arctica JP610]
TPPSPDLGALDDQEDQKLRDRVVGKVLHKFNVEYTRDTVIGLEREMEYHIAVVNLHSDLCAGPNESCASLTRASFTFLHISCILAHHHASFRVKSAYANLLAAIYLRPLADTQLTRDDMVTILQTFVEELEAICACVVGVFGGLGAVSPQIIPASSQSGISSQVSSPVAG